MVDYRALEKELLKAIDEEKGFSWRKLTRIIKLNGLYNVMK